MKPQLVHGGPATSAGSPIAERIPARDAIVDEYGPLAVEVQALQARLRVLTADAGRYETLKREIRGWFDQSSPTSKFLYETDRYLVELSAKEREATPRMEKLYRLFGKVRFLEICGITQKAVKAELPKLSKPPAFETLFLWDLTGARTVKALPKAPVEAA